MEWWRAEGGAETAKRRQVGALQMFLVLALSLPWGKARGAPVAATTHSAGSVQAPRGPPKASPYNVLDYFFYFFVLGDLYRPICPCH